MASLALDGSKVYAQSTFSQNIEMQRVVEEEHENVSSCLHVL